MVGNPKMVEVFLQTPMYFESLDSTNLWAKKHAAQLDPRGLTCIVAKEQTGGYGRRGTPWISPPGNLYMTLFFYPRRSEKIFICQLPQLLVLSAAEVIDREGIYLQIKWPNDLMYREKKCAGVLAESFYVEKRLAIALGLGLNVNTPIKEVDQPVISLSEIAHNFFDLEKLLKEIVKKFESYLDRDSSTLQAQIEARLTQEVEGSESSGMTSKPG
jgi:BirA family transcriptional regulator, biotin operon repressor / biotin---[acetyl-CoA-carboxylase] ligase